MPLDLGRVSHLLEQMHRSEDDAGDPILEGMHLVTDGARGFTWEPAAGTASIPFDHGSMGATETVDLADGDWHRGTLTADCAVTVQGFTNDEGAVLLFEVTQDGTGGWGITWDADVDFGGADDQPSQTASTVTTFMLWSSVGDSTIYGAKVGTGLTLSDDTPLEDSGAGDAGVSDDASRSDHVHPAGSSGIPPPILLASDHAVPFVFDDILQNSDGDDFLWASE